MTSEQAFGARSILSTALAAAVGMALLATASPASAETRGYVISWFATATNISDYAGNCPKTAADPNRFNNNGQTRRDRAIVNGKQVAPLDYPNALVEDPDIETVVGKYAYGFDLGGTNPATKFEDPETHEKVDNQLWRAVGCINNFQYSPPQMPYNEGQSWNSGYADAAPAWAMQITGDNLNKDGPVTITLDRTFDHLQRDALAGIRSDVTYVLNPSPRSHNELKGEIKNGVLWVRGGSIWLQGSAPYYIQVDLENTHMRMHSETGGKLVGYWGGYTDWHKWGYMYTSRCGAGDCLGIFRSVEKLADRDPDPTTGKNQKISVTWRMEAVPAFLAKNGQILANASSDGLGGKVREPASVTDAATANNVK